MARDLLCGDEGGDGDGEGVGGHPKLTGPNLQHRGVQTPVLSKVANEVPTKESTGKRRKSGYIKRKN